MTASNFSKIVLEEATKFADKTKKGHMYCQKKITELGN